VFVSIVAQAGGSPGCAVRPLERRHGHAPWRPFPSGVTAAPPTKRPTERRHRDRPNGARADTGSPRFHEPREKGGVSGMATVVTDTGERCTYRALPE